MSVLLNKLQNGVTAVAVTGVKGFIKARGAAGVMLDKGKSTGEKLVEAAKAEMAEREAEKAALLRTCDDIVAKNFDQVLEELAAGREISKRENGVVVLEIEEVYRSFILNGLMEQLAYEEKQAKASAQFQEQAKRLLAKVELRTPSDRNVTKSRKA